VRYMMIYFGCSVTLAYFLSINIPKVKMTDSVSDWPGYMLISQCLSDYQSGSTTSLLINFSKSTNGFLVN